VAKHCRISRNGTVLVIDGQLWQIIRVPDTFKPGKGPGRSSRQQPSVEERIPGRSSTRPNKTPGVKVFLLGRTATVGPPRTPPTLRELATDFVFHGQPGIRAAPVAGSLVRTHDSSWFCWRPAGGRVWRSTTRSGRSTSSFRWTVELVVVSTPSRSQR